MWDDVVEYMGRESVQFAHQFGQTVLAAIQGAYPALRQSACYGVGIMALVEPSNPQYNPYMDHCTVLVVLHVTCCSWLVADPTPAGVEATHTSEPMACLSNVVFI